jgi:alkylation response protein AidB-like acyl-CoA dehydrogenase
VDVARRLADEVLFPAALEVDRSGEVPTSHLDALADAGLYGLVGPRQEGGVGADDATRLAVTEALAGGCLSTAFLWVQHLGAVVAVDRTENGPLRTRLLGPLCRGAVRAGVAFAGLRRPGPPILRAREGARGWVLDGTAPWVTGWGHVDLLHVAARTENGAVLWALIEAREGDGVHVERLELAALDATATVSVVFREVAVDEAVVTLVEPWRDWVIRDAAGLRPNGALALGVGDRAIRLLPEGGVAVALAADLARCRRQLLESPVAGLPGARASAAAQALRAVTALAVTTGGRAVRIDQHVQRLWREALFLQVAGQTAAIRRRQLRGLLAGGPEVG